RMSASTTSAIATARPATAANVPPPTPRLEMPPSAVQLASFAQPTSPEPVRAEAVSPSDHPPIPAEVVATPNPPPFAGGAPPMPFDLATALGMTQGQNPRVAFAQAQIAQSQAIHEQARALWLPSLRAGGNYNKHEGRIQQVEGPNIIASRGAAFGGFG